MPAGNTENDTDNTFRQTVFNPEENEPVKMISPNDERKQLMNNSSPRNGMTSGESLGKQASETLKYLNNMQWKKSKESKHSKNSSENLNGQYMCEQRPKTNQNFAKPANIVINMSVPNSFKSSLNQNNMNLVLEKQRS